MMMAIQANYFTCKRLRIEMRAIKADENLCNSTWLGEYDWEERERVNTEVTNKFGGG